MSEINRYINNKLYFNLMLNKILIIPLMNYVNQNVIIFLV